MRRFLKGVLHPLCWSDPSPESPARPWKKKKKFSARAGVVCRAQLCLDVLDVLGHGLCMYHHDYTKMLQVVPKLCFRHFFFHGEGLNRFVLVCNYFRPKFWVTWWRIIATGIKIYFNDRDLLRGTRFILHLRRQQPVVNGAEESEGRKRRGGWGWITRPFLLGIWGGLGSKGGRKIPALVRASRFGVTVSTSWSPAC